MESQNQNDELYPIAVLIDELKVIVCEELTKLSTDISYSMMMSSYDLTLYIDSPQSLSRWVLKGRGMS